MKQLTLLHTEYCPRPAKFLQWIGSKRRLLPILRATMRCCEFDVFCEPFVGSGALAFDLLANGYTGRVVLNDCNADLIAMYAAVRDDVDSVDYWLSSWQKCDWQVKFHEVNDDTIDIASWTSRKSYEAARFIALRNGSFMSRGGTPKKSTCLYYDRDALYGASRALQAAELEVGDYRALEPKAGWLVYVDPPYLKFDESKSAFYYNRGKKVATLEWHKRLRKWLKGLPCDWMASNSIAAAKLYKGHIVAKPTLHAYLGNRREMTEIIATSWHGA